MAKIKIEPMDCLCELEKFRINGKKADWEEFGYKCDMCPEAAEEYGCGDMQFMRKVPERKVLDKYKINVCEYLEIQDELMKALSFGYCSWCV